MEAQLAGIVTEQMMSGVLNEVIGILPDIPEGNQKYLLQKALSGAQGGKE